MEILDCDRGRTTCYHMSKRRNHQPEFKSKVAFAAVQGIKTVSQLAKEFEIHPAQISEWKKTLQQGAPDLFGRTKAAPSQDHSAELARAQAKIGELTLDLDYLKKKSAQLGLIIVSDSLSARTLN